MSAGGYLLEAMSALDPLRNNGFGERATDWPEIKAFADATGRVSEPWELEALHSMCQCYFRGNQIGRNPLAHSPLEMFQREQVEENETNSSSCGNTK